MAGSKVGAASRWRSMPSKTRMNFSFRENSCWSATTNVLMLSHLPSRPSTSSSCPCAVNDSLIRAIVRSRRCRVVMHSCDGMIAEGVSIACRMALMARLFPVASTPWRRMVGGLGKVGYKGGFSWRFTRL